MSHRTIWLVAALTAVLVATPSLPRASTTTGASREDDVAAIQQLLDERSRAILDRDRSAFMASVARVSRPFVRRQRVLFRAMEGVDLESYRLVVRPGRFGDLARPSDARRYPRAENVMIPVTEERYRIKGFDAEDAAEDIFYTFVRQRGRWRIAEDTDLDDLALFSARHLWDRGRIETKRSERFLQLEHPCSGSACNDGPSRDFLDLAERALDQVDRHWRAPWHREVVVLVPGGTRELARMLQATIDLDNFVAFAYSTVDVEKDLDYTGHRIILNPNAFEQQSTEGAFRILAHELLHIATRDASGPFMPVFVDEGFAEVAAYDGDPSGLSFFNSQVSNGAFDKKLPKDFEFTTGSGTEIYESYQEAQSAVKFFVDRWGIGRFVDFYRRLGGLDIVPGTTRYHLDRALRDATGLGYEDFEKAWTSSIRSS
jgi:hypothetical protein